MNEEQALIAAIEADPADDTLRLAYADWLDEHDNPAGAYLRAEMELAKLGKRSQKRAPALRAKLLEQRQSVDARWLMRFEQPHLLRVNPTPFPAEWIGTDLPGGRDVNGTYGGSAYRSLPPLPVEKFKGDWKWLLPAKHKPGKGKDGTRLAKLAKANGLTLPPGFVQFANDTAAQRLIRSNTDCYFDWASALVSSPADEDGMLLRFYADSQGCCYWYLYLTPTGYSCVVASSDLYGEEDEDDEFDEDEEDDEDEERSGDVWFCAPSFEAFIYRMWIENEIWFRLAGVQFDFHDPRPMTPEMQAYLDHYRGKQKPKK